MFKEQAKDYERLYYRNNLHLRQVEWIEQMVKKEGKKLKRILDVGCGTGLHASELAKKGYKVTGIDISDEMLEIAKSRAKKYGFNLVKADICDWIENENYDLVISIFITLGYIYETKRIISAFNNIYKSLKKGGIFIFDVMNGVYALSNLEEIIEEKHKDVVIKWKRKLDFLNSVVLGQGKFYLDGKQTEDFQKFRYYLPGELELLLSTVGFDKVELYGNLQRKKLNNNSRRVFVLARK